MKQMDKEIIVCVSGGVVQAIRANFKDEITVRLWDEDSEDDLRAEFLLDEYESLDSHWESEIIKQYKNVLF